MKVLAVSQAREILESLGGETCSYTPQGGTPKKVLALVDPLRRTDVLGTREFLAKTYEVWMLKAEVAEIHEQFDTVAFRLQPSDASLTTLRITKVYPERDAGIPGDGSGMWHVEAVQ